MDLTAVLEESRTRGLLGASIPIETQIVHARGFTSLAGEAPARAVDLGSGGGLPGLVLADVWPRSTWLLVDAQQKRVDFLRWAVEELGWADRVTARHGRAEDVAREPDWRHHCDLVVARSFGPPAVVAECAAGFLLVGGRLIVSEPPSPGADRWWRDEAVTGLAELGQRNHGAAPPAGTTTGATGGAEWAGQPAAGPSSDRPAHAAGGTDTAATYHRIDQIHRCPDRFPRRPGVPQRRPLF